MLRTYLVLMMILFGSVPALFAQAENSSSTLKTATLYSPYDANSKMLMQYYGKGCLDLQTENMPCSREPHSIISYGQLRAGREWDWLNINMPLSTQTRMVSLGKKNWSDEIKLKEIRPWVKLKPGERRGVTVNTSGRDGADGSDGFGGGNSDVFRESVQNKGTGHIVDTANPKTGYNPFLTVRQGEMYLIRVVDDPEDFYILLHIDELERRRKAVVSWKRVEVPQSLDRRKY